MGKACCNVVERLSRGAMSCPVQFENQVDLQYGGILVALPALIACGILRGISRFDLSKVYYTTVQIFLSLAFMVLLRVKQLEQSKLLSCGELGRCLGMDRTPCVQTLRNRLSDFTLVGDVHQWSLELSRQWMKDDAVDGVLYVDGHVNIYYGKSVKMPERYVSRMRLCMSGSTDYWVNGAIGQPYFVIHKTANEGMIKTLTNEIIPELNKSVPHQPSEEQLATNPLLHRYMVVFDREGYSVPFFIELKKKRIAFCTYRKNVKDQWDISEFTEYTVKDSSGETVRMKLAERGVYLTTKKEKGKPQEGIWVREIRKLTTSGHQTSIITTNFSLSITDIGLYMFARWHQENYFKYAMESFGIDCLISNKKKSIPDTYTIPNPDYISLNQKHKSISVKLAKQKQKLAEKLMEMDTGELQERQMKKYLRQKAEILQDVELYQNELEVIKQKKKDIPKRIDVKETKPGEDILTVVNDRKQLIETIKMIGYWAESSLANQIRPLMSKPDEAKSIIRSIYQSNADLIVDKQNNRLCVCLHHSNFAAVDKMMRELFNVLNETQTVFPGTNLKLFYILVSEKSPPIKEI
jgi:DNA-binding transcriptional regulator/RsmH inhibitor MraZ